MKEHRNLKFKIFVLLACFTISIETSQALKHCKEKPIEQNIENADVILSGTVRKLERNYSFNLYAALVEVHRIFKGHQQVNDLLSFSLENSLAKDIQRNLTKRTNKFIVNGNLLNVYNFGSSEICESNVRPHDVRIFLLNISRQKRLNLNSSLIMPTLTSLRNLNALIENKNDARYVQCPEIVAKICNYGAVCMMNTASNLVTCECDINCDMYEAMPLCGNDGVSYPSLCHLKQTKCLQQRPIKIVDHYTCGKQKQKY